MPPLGKEDVLSPGEYYESAASTLLKMREALQAIHGALVSAQVLSVMIFLSSLVFTSSSRTMAAVVTADLWLILFSVFSSVT